MLFKILKFRPFSILLVALPGVALAVQKLKNPIGKNMTLIEFLKSVIEGVTYIAVPIIVLVLIYAGFLFVTSFGDVKKLEKAKSVFLYALVGAVLLLSANLLLDVVHSTTNEILK